MTGTQLLYQVMERIMREPETYDQTQVQCNSRFCVAGHIGNILRCDMMNFDEETARILGVDYKDAFHLVSGGAIYRLQNEDGTANDANNNYAAVGSAPYALLGARHILAFIRQHQAHLDTWVVPGTEGV